MPNKDSRVHVEGVRQGRGFGMFVASGLALFIWSADVRGSGDPETRGTVAAEVRSDGLGTTHEGSDAVVEWNRAALDAIRFASIPPPIASRMLAMLHIAIHDAVNGIEVRGPSYLVPPSVSQEASAAAALAAAANQILRLLQPNFAKTFDSCYHAQIDLLEKSARRDAGIAWGKSVAQAVLRARAFDGSNFGVDYRPRLGAGHWEPTPPLFASAMLPNWAALKPFALTNAAQFRPPAPPALESRQWSEDLAQVQVLGGYSSRQRNLEQTRIAYFWADGPGTVTPPGHWNQVAQQLVGARPRSILESSRLFALLNIALADAAIVAWDAKYAYDFWRPITAIRQMASNGIGSTKEGTDWSPLLETPAFPEYVSGHSTFSGAAAAVLAALHGSDEFEFNLRSEGISGGVRRFHRFSDAAQEAGMSRIYGGIHFMSANLQGLEAGRKVGECVVNHCLVPPTEARISFVETSSGFEFSWPMGYQLEEATPDLRWIPVEANSPTTVRSQESRRMLRLTLVSARNR